MSDKPQVDKIYVLDTNVAMIEPLAVYPLAGSLVPQADLDQLFSIGLDERVKELHEKLSFQKDSDNKPNAVIIPSTVLEELDHLKASKATGSGRSRIKDELKAINARKALRLFNQLSMDPNKKIIREGHVLIPLANGGEIHFVDHKEELFLENLPPFSSREPTNDNRIVGMAYMIQKSNPEKKVSLISNDINLRTQAELSGLGAETLRLSEVSTVQLYNGFNPVLLTKEQAMSAHQGLDLREILKQEPGNDLKNNQFLECENANSLMKYLIVKNRGDRWVAERLKHTEKFMTFVSKGYDGTNQPQDYSRGRDRGNKEQVKALQDKFNKEPKPEGGSKFLGTKLGMPLNSKITPDKETLTYLECLLDTEIPIVSCKARAGAGKTYWAAVASLYLLNEEKYRGVKYVRPVANIGADLGALPGGIKQKYGPWTAPFRINLLNALQGFERNPGAREKAENRIKQYYAEGWIEDYPTNFLAGVTFTDEIVVVDEAQYLTREQARMLVGRIGNNCKMVFIGDLEQAEASSDVYVTRNTSGFAKLIDALSANEGNKLYAHTSLSEVKRSPAAELERFI